MPHRFEIDHAFNWSVLDNAPKNISVLGKPSLNEKLGSDRLN